MISQVGALVSSMLPHQASDFYFRTVTINDKKPIKRPPLQVFSPASFKALKPSPKVQWVQFPKHGPQDLQNRRIVFR